MADSQSILYFQRALSTLYILFWLLGWASTSWDGTEADRRNSESHRLFPRSSSNLSDEFSFATERFVSSLEATVEQLNSYRRPLLVHTRNGVRFYNLCAELYQIRGGAATNMGGAAANMGGASPHCQLLCSSLQQSDVLHFVRESGENFTVPIVTSTYSNLKVNRYRGHFKHACFHLQA